MSITIFIPIIIVFILIILAVKFSYPKIKHEDIFTEDFYATTSNLGEALDTYNGNSNSGKIIFNIYKNFIVVAFNERALKISLSDPELSKKLFIEDNNNTVIVSNFEGELPEDCLPVGVKVKFSKNDIQKLKGYINK